MKYSLWIAFAAAVLATGANFNRPFNFTSSPDLREQQWVDSVFYTLDDQSRIGQLLMIRAHSDKDSTYEQEVENLVRNYRVGGLCFFQGTPERQAELTNRYQAASVIPLLISMDAEWGLGMRMRESTISFPRQLMLGAVRDNRLIYQMGREIARQCRRLGVHIDFAPVADVNNNPGNPVINDRSFGEDRYNVSAKCFQYMMGLQDGGVIACAKHFPGHGDTNVDSHLDLPVIAQTPERLDSLELFPFRVLSQYGIGSMMVAHLNVPALDERPNRPTTLSRSTVHDLLRRQIGFEGLIFTDAMEMQGVTKYFPPGEADVEALRAGNDMVLLPGNVPAAMAAIERALEEGRLNRDEINNSVRRILHAKYRLGLRQKQHIEVANIRRDLNTKEALLLKRRLIGSALTLVRDQPEVAGFRELNRYSFASLAIGDTNRTVFQQMCGRFAPVTYYNLPMDCTPQQIRVMLDTLQQHNMVLVSLHRMSSKAAVNFGLSPQVLSFLQQLNERQSVALTVFGNPYSLQHFDKIPTLLEAYTEDPIAQELAAQALFGAADIRGRLPVTASAAARFSQGIVRAFDDYRLGYDLPEAVGMSSDTLAQMDTLVQELIRNGAAPGCQLLVARYGKVIWYKAYGNYDYDSTQKVGLESMYDLASITKVSATTLMAMRETDLGRFDVTRPMSTYLPELKTTNKKDLTTLEMLIHQAGLQAWIPFYEETVDAKHLPLAKWYKNASAPGYSVPVAPNLYMADAYVDTVWARIFRSELRATKDYKYSDLGLYLTARTLQRVSGESLDAYTAKYFYRPLGLSSAAFNPWLYGKTALCVPTENDDYFRQQRIQGYVHDMGAAMLGGVSGHAGLFMNANDLAKVFQMLLNQGNYFGKVYLNSATVAQFATHYPGSTRRGIGFDMKELDPKNTVNMAVEASPNTFGHTGFTGNAVWADPDKQLIFIFLSNRTMPTMKNNKLISGDYRPRLQQIVYRAILDGAD